MLLAAIVEKEQLAFYILRNRTGNFGFFYLFLNLCYNVNEVMICDKLVLLAEAHRDYFALLILHATPLFRLPFMKKNNRVGKKLLLTGNGKCNLSNMNMQKKFL